MKKALAYAMTAVLLGTVVMLAPLMLASSDGEKAPENCPQDETLGGENEFGEEGSLRRAIRPSNLSSAGLMLIPSFLIALGAFLYLKKRVF